MWTFCTNSRRPLTPTSVTGGPAQPDLVMRPSLACCVTLTPPLRQGEDSDAAVFSMTTEGGDSSTASLTHHPPGGGTHLPMVCSILRLVLLHKDLFFFFFFASRDLKASPRSRLNRLGQSRAQSVVAGNQRFGGFYSFFPQ